MTSKIAAFGLALAIAAPACVRAADQAPVLKSVTVTLPTDSRFLPDGPGSDLANANCLICHSAGMVLNQPNLSKAAWQAAVDKMIAAFKAPIQADVVPDIVKYLVSIKGAA